MRKRHYTEGPTGIDFTSILDVAFMVMLLFFGAAVYLVESTRERPDAEALVTSQPSGPPIRVTIDATGLISIEGRPYERALVVENLRRFSARRPGATLHIEVDPDAESDALVIVVDAARSLGIESVDIETGEEPE